jgi:hypothetical protein
MADRTKVSDNGHGLVEALRDELGASPTRERSERRLTVLLVGALLLFLAPLAVFAVTGSFSRLVADDYCFSSALRSADFIQAQADFYRHTSDRYSVIFFIGLSELLGPGAIRWLPALNLALMLVGLGTLASALLPRPKGLAWVLAAAVVFLVVLAAPNRFQAFYWRTGLLTYSFPLALLALTQGWMLRWVRRTRLPGTAVWATLLLAFVAGGASETSAAMQAALLLVELALVIALMRGYERRPAVILTLAAFLGTLAALVVMALSPSIPLRQVNLPEPPGIPELILLSLRHGWDFIVDSLKSLPLPHGVALAAGGLAALLTAEQRENRKAWVAGWIAIPVILYLLMVAMAAPSAYAESAYPEARALIVGRFGLVIGLVAWGFVIGRLAASLLPPGGLRRQVPIAAALLLLAIGLYPLRAAWQALPELRAAENWAGDWDARDAEIRAQAGADRVEVREFDNVAGLQEIGPDENLWLNRCAAGYYRVGALRGTP